VPKQRVALRVIKDIIRLKWEGRLSHEQIAAALAVSKGAVTTYVGLAVAAGLDWETVRGWDERQVLARRAKQSCHRLSDALPSVAAPIVDTFPLATNEVKLSIRSETKQTCQLIAFCASIAANPLRYRRFGVRRGGKAARLPKGECRHEAFRRSRGRRLSWPGGGMRLLEDASTQIGWLSRARPSTMLP
jgi:hypothetical protein